MSGSLMMISEMFRCILYIFLVLALLSCRNDKTGVPGSNKPDRADMEEVNRYLISKDRERIQSYIERKGLQMEESPTGLWYQVTEEGSGEKLRDNDRIVIEYQCSLLDGTLCYDSDQTGPLEITLGRTGIEAGLNEGLKMLKPGSKAIFILPPFLAHGLPGDGKKIPPRSVVVYNVYILARQ
jgi:FKBP-type peptidyl-prolyl cis-trans isomerase FkpA